MSRSLPLFLGLGCMLAATPVRALDRERAARLAQLTLKALSFDQAFPEGTGSFRLGIAVATQHDPDGRLLAEAFTAISATPVHGRQVAPELLPLDNPGSLVGLSVLFVLGGPPAAVRALVRDATPRRIRTFTADPALLDQGVAVALVPTPDGFDVRVQAHNAEAQGMAFSTAFLRATTLIGGSGAK